MRAAGTPVLCPLHREGGQTRTPGLPASPPHSPCRCESGAAGWRGRRAGSGARRPVRTGGKSTGGQLSAETMGGSPVQSLLDRPPPPPPHTARAQPGVLRAETCPARGTGELSCLRTGPTAGLSPPPPGPAHTHRHAYELRVLSPSLLPGVGRVEQGVIVITRDVPCDDCTGLREP